MLSFDYWQELAADKSIIMPSSSQAAAFAGGLMMQPCPWEGHGPCFAEGTVGTKLGHQGIMCGCACTHVLRARDEQKRHLHTHKYHTLHTTH